MRRAAILGLILGSLAPAVFAQQPESPPIILTAPVQTGDLAYFVGRWRVSALDPGVGETLEMTYVVAATEGGSWFAGAGSSQDGAFNARDMWGRDPLSGEIMRVIFDGGGVFATVRGAAWDGDRLILEGGARSAHGVVRVRETITRISPDRFEAVWEAYRDGQWIAYSIETVTREL